MKIIAESQIVEQPAYLHVGYLSTQTFHPNGPLILVGVLLLLVGAFVSQGYSVFASKAKLNKLKPGDRKKRKIDIFIFSFGVLISLLSLFPFGGYTYDRPESVSRGRAMLDCENIVCYLNYKMLQGKDVVLPENLNEVAQLIEKETNVYWDWQFEDAWDNPLVLRKGKYNNNTIYYVISPGEDAKLDTKDDIVYPNETNYDRYFELLYYDVKTDS